MIINKKEGRLYIGVTKDLKRRIWEHKKKEIKGFTEKYNLTQLVYYEIFDQPEFAIQREKQLKNCHRQWKLNLINEFNPDWSDLYGELGI